MRAAFLRRHYKQLTTQLDVMCDQYDTWRIRHKRAVLNKQKNFQYILQLRLVTMDGCMDQLQDMIQVVATRLVEQLVELGDLDGLEELGIEIVE